MKRRRLLRGVLRVVLAIAMVIAGVLHFVSPDWYVRIVPSYLPAPLALVLVSGAFEIAGGVGLLVRPLRRLASWGLVALYVAVFPANLNMALHDVQPGGLHASGVLLWLRLPFQALFIAWALWVGSDKEE